MLKSGVCKQMYRPRCSRASRIFRSMDVYILAVGVGECPLPRLRVGRANVRSDEKCAGVDFFLGKPYFSLQFLNFCVSLESIMHGSIGLLIFI